MSDITPQQSIIERAQGHIDAYHGLSHPAEPGALWELRRNLTVERFALSRTVKAGYIAKAYAYVLRKYAVAKEIASALDADKRDKDRKPRPMNQLEVQTEALDFVLRAKKEQVETEAQYEEVIEVLKSMDKILFALSQEIDDFLRERQYQRNTEPVQTNDPR